MNENINSRDIKVPKAPEKGGFWDENKKALRRWVIYSSAAVFLTGGVKSSLDHRENMDQLNSSTTASTAYKPEASAGMPTDFSIENLHIKEIQDALSRGDISEAGMEVLKKLANTLTLKFEVPIQHGGQISIDLPMEWAKDYINTNITDPAEADRLIEFANSIISELFNQFLAGHDYIKNSYTKNNEFNTESFVRDIQSFSIKGVTSAEGSKDEDLLDPNHLENLRLAERRANIVRDVLSKSGISGIEDVPIEILTEKSVLDDLTYASLKSIADKKGVTLTELIMSWNKIKNENPNAQLGSEEEENIYRTFENDRKVTVSIELKGGTKETILLPLPLLLLLIPAAVFGLRKLNLGNEVGKAVDTSFPNSRFPNMKFSLPTFRFPEVRMPSLPSITMPDVSFIFSKGRVDKKVSQTTFNLFQHILGEVINETKVTRPEGRIVVNGKVVVDVFGFLPDSLTGRLKAKLTTYKDIIDHIDSMNIEGVEKVDPAIFIQAVSEVIIDTIRQNAEAFIAQAQPDSNLTFGGRNVKTPGSLNYDENLRATTLSIVDMDTIISKYNSLLG